MNKNIINKNNILYISGGVALGILCHHYISYLLNLVFKTLKLLNIVKTDKDLFSTDLNILRDLDITGLYKYLDSLTLQQEGALLHTLILFTISLCTFSILSVFFGNEIIKLFNLEERLPSLSEYFKIRNKFQRYYLLSNIGIIFVLSVPMIFIDIIMFFIG